MIKIPKFKTDKTGITIRIDISYLVHLAETNEDTLVVTDKEELIEAVKEQLESELLSEDDCNSPTKFDLLLDEAMKQCGYNLSGVDYEYVLNANNHD